ncbi:hypothetical protein P8452_23507 [Trifolium repens]|nr:hypothetical protein P8452_23507 [Trifolium repens]
MGFSTQIVEFLQYYIRPAPLMHFIIITLSNFNSLKFSISFQLPSTMNYEEDANYYLRGNIFIPQTPTEESRHN